jgi:hypothetical protein
VKTFIIKYARWIAWLLLGLYIRLMGTGLALQVATGTRSFVPPDSTGGPGPLVPILLTSWSVVGGLLISRQPRHPIGWIFSAIPFLFALDEFAWGYAYYGSIAYPGSLPFVEVARIWLHWSGRAVGATLATLLFLWFPTGRPMSRRWGALAWISVSASIVFVLSASIAPLPINNLPFPPDLIDASRAVQEHVLPITWGSYFVIILSTFIAIFSLYSRLHWATGVERQQLKWFAFASAFFVPGILLLILGLFPDSQFPDWVISLGILLVVGMFTGIAVASAIAILRYRLWDIDIIIRRTLIYGLLTGLLAMIYFTSVILMQNLLLDATNQEISLASLGGSRIVWALSTLIIAALFNPLRHRVQNLIDRRFYRQKYDAEQILSEFAFTSRDEVDPDELTESLLRVIEETLQPGTVSLWLRSGMRSE